MDAPDASAAVDEVTFRYEGFRVPLPGATNSASSPPTVFPTDRSAAPGMQHAQQNRSRATDVTKANVQYRIITDWELPHVLEEELDDVVVIAASASALRALFRRVASDGRTDRVQDAVADVAEVLPPDRVEECAALRPVGLTVAAFNEWHD